MNHEDNYDEYDVYTDVRSEICNIVSNIPLIYMYLICTTVWKIWNVTRSRASDVQKYIHKNDLSCSWWGLVYLCREMCISFYTTHKDTQKTNRKA